MQISPKQQMSRKLQAKLKELKTNKQTTFEKNQEYYHLMIKAKEHFGQRARRMAPFYRQYGAFLYSKITNNMGMFGEAVAKTIEGLEPAEQQGEEEKQNSQSQQDQGNDAKEDEESDQDPDQPEIGEEHPNHNEDPKENQAQEIEEDDEELCYLNLEVAKDILIETLDKHKYMDAIFTPEQVKRLEKQIVEVRIDLGDFYIYKQDFTKAIQEYEEALEIRQRIEDAHMDRLHAEIYYLIGLAYLNDRTKFQKSMGHIIKAIDILINRLEHSGNIKISERPTVKKPNVNRYEYLPTVTDSDEVKDLKQSLLPLLDRVEDLEIEIMEAEEFEKTREQHMMMANQVQNVFSAPTNPNVPVVSLGIFGNANISTTNPLIRIKPKAGTTAVETPSVAASQATPKVQTPSSVVCEAPTSDVAPETPKQKLANKTASNQAQNSASKTNDDEDQIKYDKKRLNQNAQTNPQ